MKSNIITRISAALIDLISSIILLTIISNFIVGPILSSTSFYQENFQIYESHYLATGLVEKNENNNLQVIIYNYDESKVDEYDNVLIYFYESYSNSENNYLETYLNTKKENDTLFVYNDDTKTFEIIGESSEIQAFYQNAFNEALTIFQQEDIVFMTAFTKLNTIIKICDYLSIGVSIAVFYLIIPLIFKQRQTLGKKIFNLYICDKNGGNVTNRTRYLVRFLIFALEIYGSLIFNGIPLIISILFMMFTKENTSIHDFVVKTKVLELKKGEDNKMDSKVIEVDAKIVEKEADNLDNNLTTDN